MNRPDEIWKTEALVRTFLEGVRSAIPLAAEQIGIMLHVIRHSRTTVDSFLDLGCGNGILGKAILAQHAESTGVFVDFSGPMLDAAQQNMAAGADRARFIHRDFGAAGWLHGPEGFGPFDVVVSGFALHHQPDEQKRRLYRDILSLLKPGGLFLNLEHVSSRTELIENICSELFVENLFAYHRKMGGDKTRAQVAQEYYFRPDKQANILAPVELQCDWLREIGFVDVDCFFKIFEIALFGGMRPPA
jgi:SAM-dependent methyltransferase